LDFCPTAKFSRDPKENFGKLLGTKHDISHRFLKTEKFTNRFLKFAAIS